MPREKRHNDTRLLELQLELVRLRRAPIMETMIPKLSPGVYVITDYFVGVFAVTIIVCSLMCCMLPDTQWPPLLPRPPPTRPARDAPRPPDLERAEHSPVPSSSTTAEIVSTMKVRIDELTKLVWNREPNSRNKGRGIRR